MTGWAVQDPVQFKAYSKGHERREVHAYLVGHVLDGVVVRNDVRVVACALEFESESQNLHVHVGEETYVSNRFGSFLNSVKKTGFRLPDP